MYGHAKQLVGRRKGPIGKTYQSGAARPAVLWDQSMQAVNLISRSQVVNVRFHVLRERSISLCGPRNTVVGIQRVGGCDLDRWHEEGLGGPTDGTSLTFADAFGHCRAPYCPAFAPCTDALAKPFASKRNITSQVGPQLRYIAKRGYGDPSRCRRLLHASDTRVHLVPENVFRESQGNG